MRGLKNGLLNIAGIILGYLGGLGGTLIAEWLFYTLIPQIPIIPTILSWPVDYGWYALVGVYSVDIFLGMSICVGLCGLSDWKMNYGAIFLSIVNFIRYIFLMIGAFNENGFKFSILLIFLLAFAGIVFLGVLMSNNDS